MIYKTLGELTAADLRQEIEITDGTMVKWTGVLTGIREDGPGMLGINIGRSGGWPSWPADTSVRVLTSDEEPQELLDPATGASDPVEDSSTAPDPATGTGFVTTTLADPEPAELVGEVELVQEVPAPAAKPTRKAAAKPAPREE